MGAPNLTVRVECYAGHRGEETPRRFFLGDRQFDVVEVLRRWVTPTHSCYKVRCEDWAVYTLEHDDQTGAWELTVLQG